MRALRLVLAWARSWQNKRQYTGGNIFPPTCREQSSKQLLTPILTNNIRDVKTQKKMLKGEGELDEKSNVQKMHIANSDKSAEYLSLVVIISVVYRVKFLHGTQFRIWANSVLK